MPRNTVSVTAPVLNHRTAGHFDHLKTHVVVLCSEGVDWQVCCDGCLSVTYRGIQHTALMICLAQRGSVLTEQHCITAPTICGDGMHSTGVEGVDVQYQVNMCD